MPHKKPDFRGVRRSFSITSIPSNTEISLGVKFYEPSNSFKRALSKLQPGDSLTATQISDDYILPKQINKPLLFVAGEIAYRELLEKTKIKVIAASSDEPKAYLAIG